MIIQGSNSPIQFKFRESMENVKDISVELYNQKKITLKHWNKEDLKINGNEVVAPLTQKETMKFPAGVCHEEIKWSDNGVIFQSEVIRDKVEYRQDNKELEV